MNTVYTFGEAFVYLQAIDQGLSLSEASNFVKYPCGAAANVAFSIARLGGQSAYLGLLSNDSFGEFIKQTLKKEGVDLTHSSTSSKKKTSIILSNAQETEIEFINLNNEFSAEQYKTIAFDETDVLYFDTSLLHQEAARNVLNQLIQQAHECNAIVFFDINLSFSQIQDVDLLQPLLEMSDIIKINKNNRGITIDLKQEYLSYKIQMNLKEEIVLLDSLDHNIASISYTNREIGKMDEADAFSAGFLFSSINSGLKNVLSDAFQIQHSLQFANVNMELYKRKKGGMFAMPNNKQTDQQLQANTEQNQLEMMQQLQKKAAEDPYRLKYHVMPPAGWMNDPNGLIQYQGKYHAFFQYYPYSPEWGPMHWGHAISEDLLHWEDCPIALTPDQSYEKGCFSGSAVDNQGALTLIYTAHDDTRSPKEVQCIATSDDGIRFEKYANNPVIDQIPPDGNEEFRDPKVFFENDQWHMVVGTSHKGKGCIVGYVSDDLRQWEYKGIVCEADEIQGDMWECPDLLDIDGEYTLLCSPMNMKDAKSIFLYGTFDKEAFRYHSTHWAHADYGYEFYAPQTLKDDRGRRILIGWMDMWKGEFPTEKNGWSGALTLPRELKMIDGVIHQVPVDEVVQMREETLWDQSILLEEGKKDNLSNIQGTTLEWKLEAEFPTQEEILTILLRTSEDRKEKTIVQYNAKTEMLIIDKKYSGIEGKKNKVEIPVALQNGKLSLQMFLDHSSLEVFVNQGMYVASNRIYPDLSSIHYDVYSEKGSISLNQFKIYRI